MSNEIVFGTNWSVVDYYAYRGCADFIEDKIAR